MEAEAATLMGKYIGAGLASIAMGGASVGIGHVVGSYLSGALRNPAAAKEQTAMLFLGIAFAEAAAGILPLALMVAIYGLELLVAVVQAYIFAILTCIYLKDALHPGH